MLLRRQTKTVPVEQGSGPGATQEIQESAGRISLLLSPEHNSRLVQGGVGIERNRPIAAFVFERGSERMRERNEPRLGVTRFDELRGLRHVFSHDKPAGNLIVNSEVPQRGFCGASVGRSRGIRNRNLLN